MKNLVFTARSLEMALQNLAETAWLLGEGTEPATSCGIVRVLTPTSAHFIHRADNAHDRRIIFIGCASAHGLPALPEATVHAVLQRAHRAAVSSLTLPLRLPFEWSEYHLGNLVGFFACNRIMGTYRWLAQIRPFDTVDVCFWRLTANSAPVRLEDFNPSEDTFRAAVVTWDVSLKEAAKQFAAAPAGQSYVPLEGAIELKEATFGAVVKRQSYTGWVKALTDEQKKFFEHDIEKPVKLRGPAGSGKTLALAMKALREVYAMRPSPARVLFATHSWAMAEQADEVLRALDENGHIDEITVFPLAEIAKSVLPDSTFSSGLVMLGADSYSGKRLQLERIDAVLWDLRRGDWLAYEPGSRVEFKNRVNAERGSPIWNSFVWDLMHEFSSVLSASNILPGVTAERRYLSLRRADWMMTLNTDAEKKFVLRVYSGYVTALRIDGLLSVDQLMNDLLNYLETFAWDYLRRLEGYDLIFVDELHLFSEPERQVLNYLTRDPSRFPRLFMALDPRQSPSEIYADFPLETVASAESGAAEHDLGKFDAVDLTKVHRFSPQILALVKFIQQSYPAMGLGADWLVDVRALESEAPAGDVPILHQFASADLERAAVVAATRRRFTSAQGGRVAVVLLDDVRLIEFQEALIADGLSTVTIKSRDDVDTLRYRKKSVVLTAAEYAAGLQFDDVIVAGLTDVGIASHLPSHQRRRILSLLYLAVSRASRTVELHLYMPEGEISTLFQQAAAARVVEIG